MCVSVWSFRCWCYGLSCVLMHNKSCGGAPAHFRSVSFTRMAFIAGSGIFVMEKENVQHAQALSQWSKLRCHWIKVASYLFEVSITPDTSTSNTVIRLILKLLSGKVRMARKWQSTLWCIVYTEKARWTSCKQPPLGIPTGCDYARESCWFSFILTQNLNYGAASEKMLL